MLSVAGKTDVMTASAKSKPSLPAIYWLTAVDVLFTGKPDSIEFICDNTSEGMSGSNSTCANPEQHKYNVKEKRLRILLF